MTDLFKLILGILASRFKARATLEAETWVLRQQVNVLRRRTPKRPHLNNTDRFLFVWLYRWFPSVLEVVAIVRPRARHGRGLPHYNAVYPATRRTKLPAGNGTQDAGSKSSPLLHHQVPDTTTHNRSGT